MTIGRARSDPALESGVIGIQPRDLALIICKIFVLSAITDFLELLLLALELPG